MKIKIILGFFLFTVFTVFSQESALDKVAKETCEYLNSKEIKELAKEERTLKLGLFILNMYSKYKTELNKEGITFDLSQGEESGRQFGEKVGMNMVRFCPEALMALTQDELIDEVEETVIDSDIEGEMVSIKGDEILTVTVKDDAGKTQKFLWISNFKGSDKLIEEKKVKRLKVKVYYKNIEVYSPKLKEYIIRKQITQIDYL